ncbi:MAG TPA: septation protein SepH [Jatrophihabitantaceae bacterium]|nr:septation protein SepH [Jatrophihabitantaceae bacterium]
MRQLRFVRSGAASSTGSDHVILETADGGEHFLLPISAPLRDAIRSDLPRLHQDEPEAADTGLGPREIQMRVRAGESPEDLAVEHEMSFERVMRFAGPVLAERVRVADEARRGRARRTTDEGQLVQFGEAVDQRFSAHGIDVAKVSWDSRRREDGNWIITAKWLGGNAEREAQWLFQLSGRSVSPLDDTAADLLSDRPIRAVIADLPPRTLTAAAAPPLAPGVVAFPAMPEAHTGPLPVVPDDVFDQEASNPDAPRTRSARFSDNNAGDNAGQSATNSADYDAPPLPLNLPADANHNPMLTKPLPRESDEQRAARARIPTWDDIMLGVRRKTD